jgi:predicted GTPase
VLAYSDLPHAEVMHRASRALVVEDGPTITHGGMPYGAGYLAAQRAGAAAIVDPRASAPRQILQIYERYPHIGPVLPALGYAPEQVDALRRTIEGAAVDLVVVATPVDLKSLLHLRQTVASLRYEYVDLDSPRLAKIVEEFLDANQRP